MWVPPHGGKDVAFFSWQTFLVFCPEGRRGDCRVLSVVQASLSSCQARMSFNNLEGTRLSGKRQINRVQDGSAWHRGCGGPVEWSPDYKTLHRIA